MRTSLHARAALATPLVLVLVLGLHSPAHAADIWTCLVSSVVLSPSDKVGSPHRLELIRDPEQRVLLVDQTRGGPVRATPLGRVRPDAMVRGATAIGPDGVAWLALSPGEGRVELYRLGDFSAPGPLSPKLVGSVAMSPTFSPDSMRLGIVPVQTNLASAPLQAPTLTFQDGSSNTLMLWNGASWLILPHIEQDA